MASVPLRSTANVAAPKDYSIPAAQVIRLLSVRAEYDGSGSAAAWLPALQILDNNGNVLATAADPAVSVAAGASADVSWFPGVKAGGGGSSTTNAEWFFVSRSTVYTVNAGATQTIPWTTLKSSDATLFSLSTVHGHTNDTIVVAREGVVFWSMLVVPAPPANYALSVFNNFDNATTVGSSFQNSMNTGNTQALPGAGQDQPRDYGIVVPTSVPFNLYADAQNFDLVNNHNLTYMEAGGLWFPTGALFV